MNLRTFTLGHLFLWIFFGKERIAVMLDTGKAVDLTGHQHQFEQIAFHFGDHLGHTLITWPVRSW